MSLYLTPLSAMMAERYARTIVSAMAGSSDLVDPWIS